MSVEAQDRRAGESAEPVSSMVVLAAVVVGLALRSPGMVLTAPVLVATVGWFGRRQRCERARADRDGAVLRWIEAVSRDLGTGLALGSSLTARAGEHLTSSVHVSFPAGTLNAGSLASGRELLGDLEQLVSPSERSVDPGERVGPIELVVVSLSVLLDHGGPAALGVERLADTLRARDGELRSRRAQAAQARASAVVVAAVPLVFGGIAALVEPDLARFYLRSLPGGCCVAVAAALSALGFAWMELEIDRGGR